MTAPSSREDKELKLIKQLDNLFPTYELITTDWDAHWPQMVKFILEERRRQQEQFYERFKVEVEKELYSKHIHLLPYLHSAAARAAGLEQE